MVDVQQAIEEAKRAVARRDGRLDRPSWRRSIEASLERRAPGRRSRAEGGRQRGRRGRARREAGRSRRGAREMQMQVEGRRVEIAVKQDGKVVGKANATLNLDRTLRTVFAFARRDQGEIPFAIDTRGVLHNPDPDAIGRRWNRSASRRSGPRPPTAIRAGSATG